MSEVKTVRRYPPCPDYDVEAMESWLSDMAAQGLVLSRDGFFFGFGYFEKTEPKKMRYRLEGSKHTSGALSEYNPPEEAQELYESMGWQYVAARGNFHIYCTDDPEARELHTDPQVQVLALDMVRRKIRRDIIWEAIWIALLFALYTSRGVSGTPLVLTVIALGTPAAILYLAIICWYIGGMFRGFAMLNKLKKQMEIGEPLSHSKDWRKGKPRYIAAIIIHWLVTLIFCGMLFSSCLNSVDNKNEIPLDEFTGTLPFATMADLVESSSFEPDKTSLGYQLNNVEFRSDFLAPVAIEYNENGDVIAPDGTKIGGGLDVTYIEARNEWLAKEIFREFESDGKHSKRYVPLEVSLDGLDRCAAFVDLFPTVVMRKGEVVVRAEFYQYRNTQLSLEQWASALAASITD